MSQDHSLPPNNFSLKNEEKLNAISHGIGAVLAIIGTIVLLVQNTKRTEFSTLSIFIYGISLITMFLVSTIYHATSKVKLKSRLRILDHINIYFLIAGTYTPVALIILVNGNGWIIFCTVWGIALFGTIFKLFYTGKLEFLSLLLYVAMGWLVVLDFENLIAQTSTFGIKLLFLGGALYTLGIVFYAWRRIPYNHFIWHLFVLGGAFSHWLMIYYSVV